MKNEKIQAGEKIPTAEEYIKTRDISVTPAKAMIAFAKLHVKAALKAAYNNYELEDSGNAYDPDDYSQSVKKDSIINSYPLTNIK